MSLAHAEDTAGEQPIQRKPGRPRGERTDEAIIAATLRLGAARGLVGLSLEAVAAEVGCSKTTIYRRWASKEELVAHALSVGQSLVEDVDTGSTFGDLEHHVTELIDRLVQGRADVIPDLVQARADNSSVRSSLNDYNSRREEPLRRILERGIARGELSPGTDPEALIELVLGPVLYRHLFSARPMDSDFVSELLERVLATMRAS